MRQYLKVQMVLLLAGVLISANAVAHPHNSPLTFIKHKTEDGRDIYTNIPKSCFSKGMLTCPGLHPIYGNNGTYKGSKKSQKMSGANLIKPATNP